uniref:Uncharacterized protein n=1 Tax=Arundo donax TaxID=35708 RepID=A0A0A8Y3Z7_ARUDO
MTRNVKKNVGIITSIDAICVSFLFHHGHKPAYPYLKCKIWQDTASHRYTDLNPGSSFSGTLG